MQTHYIKESKKKVSLEDILNKLNKMVVINIL